MSGEAIDRLVATTASGSRYAIWAKASIGWWVRAQAVVIPNGPLLEDVWRPIAPLTPWPPLLGMGLRFAFRDERAIAWAARPDLLIECTNGWRHTTSIESIATWGPDDAWPGEPPIDQAEVGV